MNSNEINHNIIEDINNLESLSIDLIFDMIDNIEINYTLGHYIQNDNYKAFLKLVTYLETNYTFSNLLPYLASKNLPAYKIFLFLNDEIIANNLDDIFSLFTKLSDISSFLYYFNYYTNTLFLQQHKNTLIDKYSKLTKIAQNKLEKICDVLGPDILGFLNTEFIDILRSEKINDEDLNAILSIFNNEAKKNFPISSSLTLFCILGNLWPFNTEPNDLFIKVLNSYLNSSFFEKSSAQEFLNMCASLNLKITSSNYSKIPIDDLFKYYSIVEPNAEILTKISKDEWATYLQKHSKNRDEIRTLVDNLSKNNIFSHLSTPVLVVILLMTRNYKDIIVREIASRNALSIFSLEQAFTILNWSRTLSEADQKLAEYIEQKLTKEEILNYFKVNNLKYYKSFLFLNKEYILTNLEIILDLFKFPSEIEEFFHYFDLDTNKEFLEYNKEVILNKYAQILDVNIEILHEAYAIFGIEIINFLANEQLTEALKSNDIQQIFELFASSKLTSESANNIFNSLIQRLFAIKCTDTILIWTKLKDLLINMPNIDNTTFFNTLNSLLATLSTNLNFKNLFKNQKVLNFLKEHNYSQEDFESNTYYILYLICNEELEKHQEEILTFLNIVCNNYIAKAREKFLEEQSIKFKDNNSLPKRISKDKLIAKSIQVLSYEELFALVQLVELDFEQKELINNPQMLFDCLEFKKNPRNMINKINNAKKEEQKEFRHFVRIFETIMDSLFTSGLLNKFKDSETYENYLPDKLGSNGLQILIELLKDNALKNIIDNSELYNNIKAFFKKYAICSNWSQIFSSYITELNVDANVENLSLLILDYELIEDKLKQRNLNSSLIEFLKLANMFTSDYLKEILFGESNFEELKVDPLPYPSHLPIEEKIKRAIHCIPLMFQRESITVPPIDKIITNNSEDKALRVIVGDTTNMINFTLGERTGSCMRVGGNADTLFSFALLNENGFHIRLEDPKTNKLISRVTCFRNGNTVFCNELRDSLDRQYQNQDLFEILTKVAYLFISSTKDSPYPIKNVFISHKMAMNNIKEPAMLREIADFKQGFDYFYFDLIPSSTIVLASSAQGEEYEEIELGADKALRYAVLRKTPEIIQDNGLACTKINQLGLINQLLKNESLGAYEILNSKEISLAIIGDDWYAYVNNEGIVKTLVLENLPEGKKKLANEELQESLNNIQLYLENSKGKDTNGR